MNQDDYAQQQNAVQGEAPLNGHEDPQGLSYPLHGGGNMPASEDQADHVSGDQYGDLIVDIPVENLKGEDEDHIQGHFGIARNENGIEHRRLQGLAPVLSPGKDEEQSGQNGDGQNEPVRFDSANEEEDVLQTGRVLGTPMDNVVEIAGGAEIVVDPYSLGRLQDSPKIVQPLLGEVEQEVILPHVVQS